MVNPFICGSSSFNHQLEKEDEDDNSQCSTPTKLTPKKSKKNSFSRNKEDKNPYSKRGLDKFSALLAEVEEKKQKIYTQIPSDDISLVRFTYSDTDSIKPIVVRVKDKKQENNITNAEKEKVKLVVDSKEAFEKHHVESKQDISNIIKNGFSFKKMKNDIRKPSFYLPAILILVLVFLAFFGRSFAILCTSIGWYLLPTINKGNPSSKSEKKKKDYTRRASDKKIIVNEWLSSSKTGLVGAPGDDVAPPWKGGRRRSW